jgi:hypothetical protein
LFPDGEFDTAILYILLFEPEENKEFLDELQIAKSSHIYYETVGNAINAKMEYYFKNMKSI